MCRQVPCALTQSCQQDGGAQGPINGWMQGTLCGQHCVQPCAGHCNAPQHRCTPGEGKRRSHPVDGDDVLHPKLAGSAEELLVLGGAAGRLADDVAERGQRLHQCLALCQLIISLRRLHSRGTLPRGTRQGVLCGGALAGSAADSTCKTCTGSETLHAVHMYMCMQTAKACSKFELLDQHKKGLTRPRAAVSMPEKAPYGQTYCSSSHAPPARWQLSLHNRYRV